MRILDYLKVTMKNNASDLYLSVGSPPIYRIEGIMQTIGDHAFSADELEELAKEIMNEKQWNEFSQSNEMDLAMVLSLPHLSRFRINILRQRGFAAIVVRRVKYEVKNFDELGLPSALANQQPWRP
jgi:Tfp pilus assembly pilus retraction ATPase PilT